MLTTTIFKTNEQLIDGVNTGMYTSVTGKRQKHAKNVAERLRAKYQQEIEQREGAARAASENRQRLEASGLYNDPAFKALREKEAKLAGDRSALLLAEKTLADLQTAEAEREADRSHADALFEAGELSEAEYATRVNAARAAKAEQEEAASAVRKLSYLVPIRTGQVKEARADASSRAAHYQAPAVRKVREALQALREAHAELVATERDIEQSMQGRHFNRMGSTRIVAGGADAFMREAERFTNQ